MAIFFGLPTVTIWLWPTQYRTMSINYSSVGQWWQCLEQLKSWDDCYPPPWVLADSAGIPQNVRIPLEFQGNSRMIPINSQWNLNGIPGKFHGNSTQILEWFQVEFDGIPMTSKFKHYKRVQHQCILKTYVSGIHIHQVQT